LLGRESVADPIVERRSGPPPLADALDADGGATWTGRQVLDAAAGHQWFPWADHNPTGPWP
jgi:hypothetical protein